MAAVVPRWQRCVLRRRLRYRTRLVPKARLVQEARLLQKTQPVQKTQLVQKARLRETPNARRWAAVAAQDARWAAGDGRWASGDAGSAAGDLVDARAERAPFGGTSTLAAAEVKCPFRASLWRAIAPRDRPSSRREHRPFLGRRSWVTAEWGAAATQAGAHWLQVEEPTSRSRRSTDGWLSGPVVAAPRHSFDIDPSTARRGAASAARVPMGPGQKTSVAR